MIPEKLLLLLSVWKSRDCLVSGSSHVVGVGGGGAGIVSRVSYGWRVAFLLL